MHDLIKTVTLKVGTHAVNMNRLSCYISIYFMCMDAKQNLQTRGGNT